MAGLDILGHVFYIWLVAGQILVARKSKWGFLFRAAGGLGWFALGVAMGMTSIWIWSMIFSSIDMYGFWKWRMNENIERKE